MARGLYMMPFREIETQDLLRDRLEHGRPHENPECVLNS